MKQQCTDCTFNVLLWYTAIATTLAEFDEWTNSQMHGHAGFPAVHSPHNIVEALLFWPEVHILLPTGTCWLCSAV